MSDTSEDERVDLDYSEIEKAIIHGDWDTFSAEIESADVTQRRENGENLLHTAAVFGETKMAGELIEQGVDISASDGEGKTPLHLALEEQNHDVATVLVENGVDLAVEDIYGNQPLWRAVFKGDVEMVALLVEHGADPTHENDNGKSPLDLAREYDIPELVEILDQG